MTIAAVLLVPDAEDSHALLREGPFGARPPMARAWTCDMDGHPRRWDIGRIGDADPCPVCGRRQRWEPDVGVRALVLAWEGEVVVDGCHWLMARLGSRYDVVSTILDLRALFRFGPPGDVAWLRSRGTLTLLDADGREVT